MSVTRIARPLRALGILAAVLLVAACSDSIRQRVPSGFETAVLAPGADKSAWRIDDVQVNVPASLTVSMDPQSRIPGEDIVWWGEPGTAPSDRRTQVGEILRESVARGLSSLGGTEGVTAEVTLVRFHAVTPRSRASCSIIGCLANTNIDFTLVIRDTATGAVLAESGLIEADPETVQGAKAREADLRGETDRVRIITHISGVVANWLASIR